MKITDKNRLDFIQNHGITVYQRIYRSDWAVEFKMTLGHFTGKTAREAIDEAIKDHSHEQKLWI